MDPGRQQTPIKINKPLMLKKAWRRIERIIFKDAFTAGYAQGLAQGRAEMRAWLIRRETAQTMGKTFSEPPPGA